MTLSRVILTLHGMWIKVMLVGLIAVSLSPVLFFCLYLRKSRECEELKKSADLPLTAELLCQAIRERGYKVTDVDKRGRFHFEDRGDTFGTFYTDGTLIIEMALIINFSSCDVELFSVAMDNLNSRLVNGLVSWNGEFKERNCINISVCGIEESYGHIQRSIVAYLEKLEDVYVELCDEYAKMAKSVSKFSPQPSGSSGKSKIVS